MQDTYLVPASSGLGYVEGENIVYDVQATDFDMAAYESGVKKFIEDDVDLILVFPPEAAIVAKEVTQDSDVPVLFSFAFIEDMGIVDSVREPGRNITGVRYPGIVPPNLRYYMHRLRLRVSSLLKCPPIMPPTLRPSSKPSPDQVPCGCHPVCG